ncbi:hypothetical protein CHRYSEOSP005_19470 [Chryseobacterium sp. Alg-005]
MINNYKLNKKINELWLLLVINLSPESYEVDNDLMLPNIVSSFDKIYLLEDFNNKIWELK